jgi:hypothetical protein
MARIFLDDLRAQVGTTLPDNTTGLINPTDHRALLINVIDSTVPDECALTQSAPLVGLQLGPAWITPTSQFNGSLGGDGVFLKPNPVGGYVEGSTTPGFTYYILCETNIIAPNNGSVSISAGLNGIPFGPIVTLVSGGDPLSASVIALNNAMPADGHLSLMYASTTSSIVTIDSAETLVIVTPTNNP